MQYLIATYWMWFVVALLVGGAVGYWLRWRLGALGGSSQVLRWGAVAFLIGLVVAVLHWLPQRPGLYLETLLLLSFWYAVGGLLGALLRGVTSATGSTSAAVVGNALPDGAALARRARAVVKSAQDEAAASAGTIEDARPAVEATEVTRVVAAAKAVDEERIAAEAKAAEKARVAAVAKAAEEARLAVEAKAAELARIAGTAKAAEAARLAAKAKAAQEARIAAAAKAAEEARLAVEAKAAELARIATAAKTVEHVRSAADAKGAEKARIAAAAKAAEDARLAAELKAADEARIAAAAKAVEEARLAAEAKAADEAGIAAAAKAAEDARPATEAKAAKKARTNSAAKAANAPGVAATAVADEAASHSGSKPPGIAAPAQGEADDLKWIKGIGPRNEKACNALGIHQFRQIANWTPDEAIWVGHHLAFPGRIEREHWIAQAQLLASGGETDHAKAVKSGSIVIDDTADEPLDQASAEMLANSLPEQAAFVEGEDKHAGRRPYGLASARGQPDNLKKIRGIGPQNERRLHALGIWHFSQIAAWSEDNVKWVGSYLAFAGRIDREKWIAQARDLAAGSDTEFSRRVTAGKVVTSKDDGASG
jgi:predicted flap endonuclease-1-like 5' DNA nuclease